MANEEGLIREVDEELAGDKLWSTIRNRAPLVIAAALAVVVAVAVQQALEARRRAAADDASIRYSEILETAAPKGYAVLARLQAAAARAQSGDREGALAHYRSIYEGPDAPERIRDLARVRAAYLALADGRDAVLSIAGPLEADESPLGAFAREAIGLAALRAGDYQTAEALFRALDAALTTPQGVRLRAAEFAALASAARAKDGLSWPDRAAIAASPASPFGSLGDLGAVLERATQDAVEAVAGDIDGPAGEDEVQESVEATPTEPDAAPESEPDPDA